jgi:hypothetical protein
MLESPEQQQRTEDLLDLETVMKTKAGRAVMSRLFCVAGVFKPCFTGNSKTFYNEGRRDVGLEFFTDIKHNFPELYTKAELEYKHQQERLHG